MINFYQRCTPQHFSDRAIGAILTFLSVFKKLQMLIREVGRIQRACLRNVNHECYGEEDGKSVEIWLKPVERTALAAKILGEFRRKDPRVLIARYTARWNHIRSPHEALLHQAAGSEHAEYVINGAVRVADGAPQAGHWANTLPIQNREVMAVN